MHAKNSFFLFVFFSNLIGKGRMLIKHLSLHFPLHCSKFHLSPFFYFPSSINHLLEFFQVSHLIFPYNILCALLPSFFFLSDFSFFLSCYCLSFPPQSTYGLVGVPETFYYVHLSTHCLLPSHRHSFLPFLQ